MQKSAKEITEMKKEDEELSDTPTVRVLYEIILEMHANMTKMEAKLEEYEKWIVSKKRKINIIDWLNEKYKNYSSVYSEWIEQITIDRHHLEMVFDNDYVSGVGLILESLLCNNSDNLPIKCFDQKENKFYIFDKDKQKWEEMLPELFGKLMIILYNKVVDQFILWRNENEEKFYADDNYGVKYAENLKKVMGGNGNISFDIISLRIRKDLFKYLKVNVKIMTEIIV